MGPGLPHTLLSQSPSCTVTGPPSSMRAEDTESGQTGPPWWGGGTGRATPGALPSGRLLGTPLCSLLAPYEHSHSRTPPLLGSGRPRGAAAPRGGRPLPASVLLPAWLPGCRPPPALCQGDPCRRGLRAWLAVRNWFGRSWFILAGPTGRKWGLRVGHGGQEASSCCVSTPRQEDRRDRGTLRSAG